MQVVPTEMSEAGNAATGGETVPGRVPRPRGVVTDSPGFRGLLLSGGFRWGEPGHEGAGKGQSDKTGDDEPVPFGSYLFFSYPKPATCGFQVHTGKSALLTLALSWEHTTIRNQFSS